MTAVEGLVLRALSGFATILTDDGDTIETQAARPAEEASARAPTSR